MIGPELPYIKQQPLKGHCLIEGSLYYVCHRCTLNARRNSDTEREQTSEYL